MSQAPGECNFHMFHLLLAGAGDELLKQLCLERDPAAYTYTKQVNIDRNLGLFGAENEISGIYAYVIYPKYHEIRRRVPGYLEIRTPGL